MYVIRYNSGRVGQPFIGPCNCGKCGGKKNISCKREPSPIFVSSSPCEDCTRVMRRLNIKKIAYSNNVNEIVYTRLRDYETYGSTAGKRYMFKNKYFK